MIFQKFGNFVDESLNKILSIYYNWHICWIAFCWYVQIACQWMDLDLSVTLRHSAAGWMAVAEGRHPRDKPERDLFCWARACRVWDSDVINWLKWCLPPPWISGCTARSWSGRGCRRSPGRSRWWSQGCRTCKWLAPGPQTSRSDSNSQKVSCFPVTIFAFMSSVAQILVYSK